ncbi:MAG: DUF2807 domain-containing protein [Flavobacteriales bacterium]|nr:DUF2807 domain-containing protein [Flavobacteriales bacterium]
MKTNLIIATAFAGLSLISCNKDKFPYCIRANGNIIEETRTLTEFEDVDFNMPGKLYIKQDTTIKNATLTIKTSENIMDRIETDVKSNTLKITDNQCIRKLKTFEVYLTVKDLEDVRLNGSGDVITENTIVADALSFSINGSGSVDASVKSKELLLDINGSGDMDVEGQTNDIDIDINGSGNVHAYDVDAINGYVDISGSGNCEINASDALDVGISGSGNVYYLGSPRVTVNTSGSGSIQAK